LKKLICSSISGKKDPRAVRIGYDVQKLALDILATCIFGLNFDTLNGRVAEPLIGYNYSVERLFNPIRFIFPRFNNLPLTLNQKLNNHLNVFDKYCWEIMEQTKKKIELNKINEKISENDENKSVIQLMYESGMAEGAIRDNVSFFFLAGHETTATAISWICSILATHPEVQEKARKEAFEKIPDSFTYDNLKELNYIEGLIKESLRMNPPVTNLLGRHVSKDTTLNNIFLPANTTINMDLTSMGYDPNIWENPQIVKPERWYNENLTKEQRSAWMPFSFGPRICIGMNFSLLEQKIFLVKILKRFKDIKLVGEIKPKLGGGLTYCPSFDKLVIQFVNK